MSTVFKLNTEKAKAADAPARINQTGPYLGKFTRAELVTSRQGTQGVDFSFVAEDGQRADYLTLWTVKKDGTELSGLKVLHALLACLALREVASQAGTVRVWDNEQKKEVDRAAELLPTLMNRPIGVVLQREEYWPENGNQKRDRMNLVTVFQHGTNLMAKEILDRKPTAEALAKFVPTIKDKLAADRPQRSGGGGGQAGGYGDQGHAGAGYGGGFDQMDDDIPF
ncbi:hypothetical protein DEH84_06825 [Aquabacterium olei]|uniref:Uncharacterized protein n=1 Tax=Aquabacterium olei TaxID=1296669 RepID=A0A2U8FQ38_9BURK|nr:hypothetical protein [Aquabacterium olei]AWI53172.1 hypothetical protein DEH84_06825 [Aquabacterium olei]